MPEASIVSHNVFGSMYAEGMNKAVRRWPMMDQLLRWHPDVLILQEAWWPNDEPDYWQALRDAGYEVIEHVQGDKGHEEFDAYYPQESRPAGRYGLITATRLPSVGSVSLVSMGEPSRREREVSPITTEKRYALRITVEKDGHPLEIYNVHGTWVKFLRGAKANLQKLAEAVDSSTHPTIIAGDFNTFPFQIRHVLPHWHNGLTPSQQTFPSRSGPAIQQKVAYAIGKTVSAQFDGVYFNPNQGTYVHAVRESLTGSDHIPVRARVTWGIGRGL